MSTWFPLLSLIFFVEKFLEKKKVLLQRPLDPCTRTHPRPYANFTQPWLDATQPEGGAKPWLISIPIQPHKCVRSLTWRFKQHQTQRGRKRGFSGVVHGTTVRHGWSKIQSWHRKFRQVHSPHWDTDRSGHRPRSVRKSAQPKQNFTRSQEIAFLHQLSTVCGGWRLSPPPVTSVTFTPASAELWPVRTRAPGHPWGWRLQPGWICSGSCGRRGNWSLWCSFRCPCFPCRSSTPPAWVNKTHTLLYIYCKQKNRKERKLLSFSKESHNLLNKRNVMCYGEL